MWNPGGPVDDHYRLTRDAGKHKGESFLFVTTGDASGLAPYFDAVTLVREAPIRTHKDWTVSVSHLPSRRFQGLLSGRMPNWHPLRWTSAQWRTWLRSPQLWLFVATVLLFSLFPQIDIAASSLFHDPGSGFTVGHLFAVRVLHEGWDIAARSTAVVLALYLLRELHLEAPGTARTQARCGVPAAGAAYRSGPDRERLQGQLGTCAARNRRRVRWRQALHAGADAFRPVPAQLRVHQWTRRLRLLVDGTGVRRPPPPRHVVRAGARARAGHRPGAHGSGRPLPERRAVLRLDRLRDHAGACGRSF